VPLQDRFGLDDGHGVRHQLAEGDGLLGQGLPFGVGQQDPFPKLIATDTVLLDQVLDSQQQRFLDLAGDVSQHPLPRHRLSPFDPFLGTMQKECWNHGSFRGILVQTSFFDPTRLRSSHPNCTLSDSD
jgi:hypothetical protein